MFTFSSLRWGNCVGFWEIRFGARIHLGWEDGSMSVWTLVPMQQGIKSTTLIVWTFWKVSIFMKPLVLAFFSQKQIHNFSSHLLIILMTMLLSSLQFQLWKDILASAGGKWKSVCFSWGLEVSRGEGRSGQCLFYHNDPPQKTTIPRSWQLLSTQLKQTGACRIF